MGMDVKFILMGIYTLAISAKIKNMEMDHSIGLICVRRTKVKIKSSSNNITGIGGVDCQMGMENIRKIMEIFMLESLKMDSNMEKGFNIMETEINTRDSLLMDSQKDMESIFGLIIRSTREILNKDIGMVMEFGGFTTPQISFTKDTI